MKVWIFGAEQDEGLEKLEGTIISTKHIALAVNEELNLHTRLIVCLSIICYVNSFVDLLDFYSTFLIKLILVIIVLFLSLFNGAG